MNIYIVGSNLLFSAAIKPGNSISKFILQREIHQVKFYAPEMLKVELENHFSKMVDVSKLSRQEVRFNLNELFNQVTFIEDQIIPWEKYITALRLVRDIDPNDVTFVALTEYLNETLWIGDNELYMGLKAKGYQRVVNFSDLRKIYSLD